MDEANHSISRTWRSSTRQTQGSKFEKRLHITPCTMENSTEDPCHTHGLSVDHQKKVITYLEKLMKESIEHTSPTIH